MILGLGFMIQELQGGTVLINSLTNTPLLLHIILFLRCLFSFDPTKDQVYVLRVDDFGTLQQKISEVVDDATENGYGKTVELSVYSHAGTDGPVGTEPTSGKYNLEKKTKNPLDRNQLSSEGWDAIDFNFDEEESIAAFYGCQAISFVERFAAYQDAAYVAGYGGRVGVSESATTWDANWYTSDGEDLYMWDGMGIEIFKRVPEELKTDINGYEIDPAWDPDWDEHYWDLRPQELETKTNFTTNVGITKNKDGKIVIYGKSNGSKEESKD